MISPRAVSALLRDENGFMAALSRHVAALSGWRRQVFGEDALALRSGATALAADGKRLKLVLMDRS